MLDTEDGCDCTFNSSFAIPWQHIIAVQAQSAGEINGTVIFNDSNCHKRWSRHYLESKEPFPVFYGYLKQAMNEDFKDDIADEDQLELDDTTIYRLKRSERYAEIRKFTKLLDVAVTDSTNDDFK